MALLKKITKVYDVIETKFRFGFFSKLLNVNFIGKGHRIETGVRIIGRSANSISINANFYCNVNCHFYGEIIIGEDVMIGPQTIIWSRNHNFEKGKIFKNIGHSNKKIVIGNNVWIGANVVILPGVVIPNNTVVAAGSVVTKKFVDEYTLIAGNPAKVLKEI